MRAWWLLPLALVALMLEVLILVGAMPLALRAVSAVSVAPWTATLVYVVVGRW